MAEPTSQQPGCYTEHGVSGYGVAAKLSRAAEMDDAFVRKLGEEMMVSIAEKCMARGARCIGHIKSHIRSEFGIVKADTIGTTHGAYSSGRITAPVKDLYIAVNSIVQGIPEEAVKTATLEGMHEVAERFDIVVVKEKEHTYFDEFDFVASKQDYIKQLEAQLGEDANGTGEAE